MATSTNYLWTEPNDSDLVKNGASAIRTLGNAIDASLWSSGYGQAGKNKIINGDLGIWQRGTTFTDPATGVYTADRWRVTNATANPTSRSVTQQAFTAGTAPVAGYEGAYFIRQTLTTVGTCTGARLEQRIEDVRTFAGQTATISFWAKSDSNRTNEIIFSQNFGSGGSTQVDTLTSTFATTSSWARFTFTISIASVSGKTIGTSSFISLRLGNALTNGSVLDIWGVQVEAGSTATPFQTASGGSPQAELAMCQRYFYNFTTNASADTTNPVVRVSTTIAVLPINLPVPMRSAPTLVSTASGASTFGRVVSYDVAFTVGVATVTATAIGTALPNTGGTTCTEVTLTHGVLAGTQVFASWDSFGVNACNLSFSAEL